MLKLCGGHHGYHPSTNFHSSPHGAVRRPRYLRYPNQSVRNKCSRVNDLRMEIWLCAAARGENSVHYWSELYLNQTLASGLDYIQTSTGQHSCMKRSQRNPNTNTSLNNSKLLRLFLLVFFPFFFLSDIPFAWWFSGEHSARLENFNMFFFFFSFSPSRLCQPGSKCNIMSAQLLLSNHLN